MKNARRRAYLGERGSGLVELAMVLLLLLVLLGGLVDLGTAFGDYIAITDASREGARYAAMHASDAGGITTAATQSAQGSGLGLSVSITGLGGEAGSTIVVTVQCPHHMLMQGILGIADFRLSSSTRMVIY
jgi:Flp pilus assembly protein TadG